MPTCKGCKTENHPAYDKRYNGYCLECFNASAPERDDLIRELTAQRDELLAACREAISCFHCMGNHEYGRSEDQVESAIARCEKETGK